MKCLILGGGGFIGSHLCEALLQQGHSVRIFDRPNLLRFKSFREEESLEWFEGDFVNQEHLENAVSGCDAIYHLISTTLPKSSNANPCYDVETNVIGTIKLLELSVRHNIRKFIFISSGGTIYGLPTTTPIPETHPTEPICSYGIAKLAIEKYLHLFHTLHGLNYCALRLANPFGERQRIASAQGAVATFLDHAVHNSVINIWGDGSVVRDFFYVSDATSALCQALDYQGENLIFNIGSGVGHSLNQILDMIEEMLGRKLDRNYLPAREFDVPVSILDISSAKKHLGWEPQTSIKTGLAQTLEWLKSQ